MTARADVGRTTYFRYFKSKEEVLSFKLLALYRRYRADFSISRRTSHSDLAATLSSFFSFWLTIRETMEQIVSAGYISVLFSAYTHIMENAREEAEGGNGYEDYFIMSGILGVLYIWITNGYRESPEELADTIVHKVASVLQ